MCCTYKHMSFNTRKDIESLLNLPRITRKQIASKISYDPKSVSYEIKNHRYLSIRANQRNKCGKQKSCTRVRLCSDCPTGKCKFCKHDNCNEICSDFTSIPVCHRLERFPFVCSGCKDIEKCSMPKFFYSAEKAQNIRNQNVTEWKCHIRPDNNQMSKIIKVIQDGIQKRQSLDVIVSNNQLPISVSTAYRYINDHRIPGVSNIDLLRKVSYAPRRSVKPKLVTRTYEHLAGRRFSDYISHVSSHPDENIWQMDTVIGLQTEGQKCVLTLLHVKSNLQLYFILKEHTALEVIRVFTGIYETLGPELFKKTFSIVLTDNGSEFSDPLSLETDPNTGEKLISVFYCEARRSDQKGKCEKNHEHFRQLIPKGKSMNPFSQNDMNFVSNMVNNYSRKSLQYHSPFEVSRMFLEKKVHMLNNLHLIQNNQVNMAPIL